MTALQYCSLWRSGTEGLSGILGTRTDLTLTTFNVVSRQLPLHVELKR